MSDTLKQNITALMAELEEKRGTEVKMFIGLDGFVDEILHAVDRRLDFDNFTRIKTLQEFGTRIAKAAGLSTNIELVNVATKLGGNGPIFANALIEYGVDMTYIGSLGEGAVHPVFADMAARSHVISICDPGHTDACEFEDGKLMLGKITVLNSITWERFCEKMGGIDNIVKLMSESTLFGMENWTMIPNMSNIWEHMINDIFPLLPDKEVKPIAFFDLADPEKRTKEDIVAALSLIAQFEQKFRVILGLNYKESFELTEALDMQVEESLEAVTKALYEKLHIHCLLVHPTKEAAHCQNGQYFYTEGPFTPNPKLTTGAGDNFNAGFCLGQALNLTPQSALVLAAATSGFYVRKAKSPTYNDIITFLEDWREML